MACGEAWLKNYETISGSAGAGGRGLGTTAGSGWRDVAERGFANAEAARLKFEYRQHAHAGGHVLRGLHYL